MTFSSVKSEIENAYIKRTKGNRFIK